MVDPMIRHGVLPLVIATIGLAILMKEAVREFYGADAQPFPPLAAATNVTVFGAAIAVQSLVVLAISIAAVVALQLFLNGTRTGRCMQATAQNPTVARLLGIPVERMILYTFLINAALVDARLDPDHADLSRQIHQRRVARPLRLHRGDRRRLQPGPRRHRRRRCCSAWSTISPPPISRSQYRMAIPLLHPDRGHPVPAARSARPGRGAHGMRRRPSLLAGVVLALVAAFLLVAPFGFRPYGIFILSMWAVMTIAAIGLNLTLGYAGQISLAQAAFVGIGAYITAYLTTRGWPFWTDLCAGGRRLLRDRLAARLSGAARAAPLPRLRDAGLQHAGLSGLPQRGMADRRHLRHQQRPAARRARLVDEAAARVLLLLPRASRAGRRSRPGG